MADPPYRPARRPLLRAHRKYLGRLIEQLLEPVIVADAGLHHLGKRAVLGVLGRDLEIADDVMSDYDEFPHLAGLSTARS